MKNVIIILIFFLAQALFAQNDIILQPGDTLRVHPIGDSITRGKEGDNYRHYLKTRLRNEAKMEINFVGQCPHAADVGATWADNQALYDALEGDIEHDGWGGLTIQQVTDMTSNTKGYPKITIEQMLADSPSDVILLMIGTNNEFFIQYSEGAEEALATLIGRITAATEAHLIVSTIPPTPLPITNGRIETFNAAVPGIVDSFKTLGKNISFIDINSYMDPNADILDDSCHPDSSGNQHIADGWYDAVTAVVTGVNEKKKSDELPAKFGLEQNYPNPFNPATNIKFSVSEQANVSLKIFDSIGKEVANLVDGIKTPGNYQITFNALNLSSGIYFYKMETNGFREIRKMVLLK